MARVDPLANDALGLRLGRAGCEAGHERLQAKPGEARAVKGDPVAICPQAYASSPVM